MCAFPTQIVQYKMLRESELHLTNQAKQLHRTRDQNGKMWQVTLNSGVKESKIIS